jgi:hypothetical protein
MNIEMLTKHGCFSGLDQIKAGLFPVSIFNRNIFRLLLGLFTGFYGNQTMLVDNLIESVYADSIVPPLDDTDNLAWLQAITDVWIQRKIMFIYHL